MRNALILAAALAIAVSVPTNATGAEKNRLGSASAFARRIVRLIGENRYAEAWRSLYPLHQQAAPLDRYIACENLTPIAGSITSLRALRAWDAPVDVAGLPNPVAGAKVTLRVVIADPSIRARTVFVKTVGLVTVQKRWTWLLPTDRYAAYLAGICPQ
jgi:hypothetical protein